MSDLKDQNHLILQELGNAFCLLPEYRNYRPEHENFWWPLSIRCSLSNQPIWLIRRSNEFYFHVWKFSHPKGEVSFYLPVGENFSVYATMKFLEINRELNIQLNPFFIISIE